MKPFQFTLRDLFLMTTLIAVGMGGIVWAKQLGGYRSGNAIIILTASVPIFSAGCCAPFHQKIVGILIGLFANIGLAIFGDFL